MKGLLFNIQRFSIHDGPGIRTTVFLKGCPLNCKWCANPESKSTKRELFYNKSNCIGCGACIKACPNEALRLDRDKIIINKEKCSNCFHCVDACIKKALYIEGEYYTLEALVHEVEKDRVFYEKSGGGVTLSGGEPLLQQEFVLAFLMEMKSREIHTVVETSGYVSQECFTKVIPYIDFLYMDIKHPDKHMHKQYTGVENELILKNIETAIRQKKEIVARIPVIPRFNDSKKTMKEFISLIKRLKIQKIELLPFHQLGMGKWECLGLDYIYKNDKNMKKEELNWMAQLFEIEGIDVQIGG
ncbi:MAG: glycyl-radical enzyme activating protein [Eubacteriales bacterium]